MSATIQDLQTHIEPLATTVNQLLQQGSGNIPAQTIINPEGNVSIYIVSVYIINPEGNVSVYIIKFQ